MWIVGLTAGFLALMQGMEEVMVNTGPHHVPPEVTTYQAQATCESNPISVRIERRKAVTGVIRYRDKDHAVPDTVLREIEHSNHGPAIGFSCLEASPTLIFTIYKLEGQRGLTASQAKIEFDKAGAMASHTISKLTMDQYGAMYGSWK